MASTFSPDDVAQKLREAANFLALCGLEEAAELAGHKLGHSFPYAEALDDRSVTLQCHCGAPAFIRLGQPSRGRALRQQCPTS